MNYKVYILLLLFISVLNKTEPVIFADGEEKDVTATDNLVYIGMKIEKSGLILLDIKSTHTFKKEDFSYGLSNDDTPPSSFKTEYMDLTKGIFSCKFSKEENENFIFVKITGLSSGEVMKIKASFSSDSTLIVVIVIVVFVLLIILAIVCCIFRKFLRCLCCMK